MIDKAAFSLAAAGTVVVAPALVQPEMAAVLGYPFEIGPMGVALTVCLIVRFIKLASERERASRPAHWSVVLAVLALALICAAISVVNLRPGLLAALCIGGVFGAAGKLIVRMFDRRAGESLGSLLGIGPEKGDEQ